MSTKTDLFGNDGTKISLAGLQNLNLDRSVVAGSTQQYKTQLSLGIAGYFQQPEQQQQALKGYINDNLFPMVKFITHLSVLDYGEVLSLRILNDLNVPDDQRRDFWNSNRNLIHETIRTKRNNVQNSIKKAYMGKFKNVFYTLPLYVQSAT